VRHHIAPVVAPVNPLTLLGLVGVDLRPDLRSVGVLAALLGFGISLNSVAVQTYLNREVPLDLQGRVFALKNALASGLSIIPLLLLGGIASLLGVSAVLLVVPFAVIALALAMHRVAKRYTEHAQAAESPTATSLMARAREIDISTIAPEPDIPAAQ
jgi:hypothetical protein